MSLLQDLKDLGAELQVSAVPTSADLAPLLGAVIHYLETGSVEPPKYATLEHQAVVDEAAQLRARIAELEAAQPPAPPTPPSPVAPEPPSPVAPEPPVPVSEVPPS